MEHIAAILGLGVLAGVITTVADAGFGHHWGAPQFFMVWLIGVVVCYGGFLILDGDGDFWS